MKPATCMLCGTEHWSTEPCRYPERGNVTVRDVVVRERAKLDAIVLAPEATPAQRKALVKRVVKPAKRRAQKAEAQKAAKDLALPDNLSDAHAEILELRTQLEKRRIYMRDYMRERRK